MAIGLGASACGDKGGFPDAALPDGPPPGGTISMAWTFTDGGEPIELTPCTEIGAVAIRVVATPVDAVQGTQFSFDCSDLQGTSIEIAPATYNLRIEVLAVGLIAIGDPVFENGVAVKSAEDTALPEYTFDISRTGDVTFTINTRESAGNCAAVASGGAELSGLDVLLTTRNNQPIADVVIEVVTDGGTETFVNNTESTPIDLAAGSDCIENDWQVSIKDVPSGEVRLVIAGYQVGVLTGPCYQPALNPAYAYYDFSIIGGGTMLDLDERVLLRVLPETTSECSFP